MTVTIEEVKHPLIADSLATIRDRNTPNALFRTNLERIGTLLLAEAAKSLSTTRSEVETPLTTTAADRLSVQPVIVPVLRAGLGFVHAAQQLLPDADIGFIGMARNEETFQPEPYVNKLPTSLAGRPVFVIDPMLATGGSLLAALENIVERGPIFPITVVCALAAPEGLDRIKQASFDVAIYTAAIDDRLNENAYIVPGLGDAGDRLFGMGT